MTQYILLGGMPVRKLRFERLVRVMNAKCLRLLPEYLVKN